MAVVTESVGRSASAEVREQTLKTAALLEGLGHRVEEVPPPVPEHFADDFVLYWAMSAMFLLRTGRVTHGASWDPSKLDNLTRGLARYSERHAYRLPVAIARLKASSLVSARFFRQYDVVLTPTLAHATPLIGHLDPFDQDYDTVMDKLMDWVAFTPLQNATGDPAVSLPLAETANGMPLGMMFGAGAGREASLLALALELEEAQPFARIQDA